MGMSTNDTHGRRPRPRFYGKYPVVVVDNEVKDGQPWGLLTVEHSTLLEDNPGDAGGKRKLRCKALPCQTPGAFILPDIGANVWLEYVQGDPRNPVWTGAFFNEASAPKNDTGQKPTAGQRLLASVTGHMVMLDDDNKKLVLKDCGGNSVTLADQDGIEIKVGSNKITLDSRGLTIEAAGHKFVMADSGTTIDDTPIALKGLFDWVAEHTHVVAGTAAAKAAAPPLLPVTPNALSTK